MSREGPPAPARVPAPPPSLHSLLWLGLPLLGLALPFAYMFVQDELGSGTFTLRLPTVTLTRTWLGVSLASALVLLGCMAARRKGRALWLVMDIVAGALPWVVGLAAQSVASEGSFDPWSRRASQVVWGVDVGREDALSALLMSHARGLGALMSATLWAAAAVACLLPRAEAPRWRGAGLVIVALPAWGVAYGFLPGASGLPFFGAALLSGVLLFAGTQESPEARRAARGAILLATLSALALAVCAACETIAAGEAFGSEGYFRGHASLHAVMSAAGVGALVLLLPAALAMPWLRRRGDPGVSSLPLVTQLVALGGILALDAFGTQLAVARVTPDPWPPWADVEVQPLPLTSTLGPASRGQAEARFILTAGALRDAEGRPLARLSDAVALRAALTSAPLARVTPSGLPSRRQLFGATPELGERLAIVASEDVPRWEPPTCPGRRVSVLLDRSLSMADLRAFVEAALASDVAEVDVLGPQALSPSEKRALRDALRAIGQESAFPVGAADEQAYLDALVALPPTGFAPLDTLRHQVAGAAFMTPSPCWLGHLAGDAEEPTELGERLNEAMPEREREPRPVRLVTRWLDPSAEVGAFLLRVTGDAPGDAWLIWTLDPPAP